jgi:hypothetical protein
MTEKIDTDKNYSFFHEVDCFMPISAGSGGGGEEGDSRD